MKRNLDAVTVRARLGLSDDLIPWLEQLELIGPPTTPLPLPAVHEANDLFTRLDILPADAADIIDAWPAPDQSPEVWWLLERCHRLLVSLLGESYPSSYQRWPPLPPHLGAISRLFYVYMFLAALPTIRQWHHEHEIPDDISWATLADLGEHIAIHRRIFGTAGLDVPDWMTLHFQGALYRLGRLHFERRRPPSQWLNVITDDVPDPDAPVLALHIPEAGGPLEPGVCDESFALARDFFASHFLHEQYHIVWCTSWLLDPQLNEYLPPASNIIRFQRRFHLVPGGSNGDEDVMRFVFRRVKPSLDELPQRTTLERASVGHLRAGRHWQRRSGWFALQGE